MALMYDYLFNHPLIEEYLGCFQFGAMRTKTTMNICLQVFV